MNNNSKRKNRPSGVSRYATEIRQPKSRVTATGIYNNVYFMHAATALVGSVVQVRLASGNIYEGVFNTFSFSFDVALELPLCIKSSTTSPVDEGKFEHDIIVFPHDTVVSISAKDFDSQFATAGAFQTDAAISDKCNGARFEEKELEPWDASDLNGDTEIELDGAANGWDPNEMFRQNEHAFGVQSTFDDSLSSYTVQLNKEDSDEYKEAEAKAEKLAAEIENNPAYRERVDLENGDEEALFAAVERPPVEVEVERESERDRDREREREREERERERDRDRERDREDRERNKRGGGGGGGGGYEPREIMTERYITKPRSMILPPPPVAMASSNPSLTTTTSQNSGPSQRGGHMDRCGDMMSERNERIMNAPLSSSVMGQQQSNSTQASASSMAGGMKSSTSASSGGGAGMGPDSGSKYGGGSMMKRKTVPQGGKLRNTPPSSNAPPGMGGSGGGAGMSQSGGSNQTGGGKGGGYQTMPMQNQSSYSSYSQIMHGQSTYRNQSHMGGPSKLNGDSNQGGGKPMPQRNMRQYQSGQSNSSMNYGEPQNQISMNKPHIPPHGPQMVGVPSGGNSSSPPLQSGGAGGLHGHSQSQSNIQGGGVGMSGLQNQPPPQPQRQMRTRDNQMQELRQFGHDFQLGGGSGSSPQQPQSQSQSQMQQQQTQPHISMAKAGGGHQPQPSVSPPQQQQQQQQQQQSGVAPQQTHMPMQHIPQQHLTQALHAPPAHAHVPPQPHYVAQPQMVPQQQQPPQQQQHVPNPHMQQPPQQSQKGPQQPTLIDGGNMMHVTKGIGQQQQQQQQPTQQQQTPSQQQVQTALAPEPQQHQQALYHAVPSQPQHQQPQQQQTSPPIADTPPQQQQQITKTDTTPVSGNSVNSASTSTNGGDKATTPTSTGTTTTAAGTTAPKKTHVLNPSAKPFTPRSPSTPNPSRPHTPQTPVPLYTTGGHMVAATGQPSLYVMPSQQPAFQAPSHPQAGQQPRMRRGNYGPMAASQTHVSATAATGQPLLAAAPIPTQFLHYSQTPHAPHFQSQSYTPMVRMYEPPPQQLQYIPPTPPSTTPSPGQHQTFHPPPQPSPAGGGPQHTFAPQIQPQTVYHPLVYNVIPQLMNPYYPAPPQHPQQIVMQQHQTQ